MTLGGITPPNDSTNFFTNRNGLKKASLQQHQYGASVGGRVIKDKTFFFATGDYTLQDRTTFLSPTLPSFVLPAATLWRQKLVGDAAQNDAGFASPLSAW